MEKIEKMGDDLAVIQSLGDNPNTDNGLSAAELKAAFDKAPLAIQKFINNVLVVAINAGVDDYLQKSGGTVEGALALLGPLVFTEGVHYGKEEPSTGVEGQLFLVEITD